MADKVILRKIANKLPHSILKIPYAIFYYITNWRVVFKNYKLLEEGIKHVEGIDKENVCELKRCLRSYSLYMNRAGADKYLQSYFFNSDFRHVKTCVSGEVPPNEVILICCVKNDLTRIKYVYEHHKKIGVKHFAFLDNGSTDGTFEYLMQLEDVDLFQTHEQYHAGAKAAWTRKIQNSFGFNRWYLIVDSDELFSYIGMEMHPIQDLIEYAEKNHIKRIRSLLLDMYSDEMLFNSNKSGNLNMIKDYCYFDADSYHVWSDYRGVFIRGGSRSRIIKGVETPLLKFPLIYAEYEDIWADHTPMPFKKNFGTGCLAVLRHYKFLPEDRDKYVKIARDGNYNNNSYEYKQYVKTIKSNKNMTFWYEKSCKYLDSSSLLHIPFLIDPFEN